MGSSTFTESVKKMFSIIKETSHKYNNTQPNWVGNTKIHLFQHTNTPEFVSQYMVEQLKEQKQNSYST